ncbi:thioredoxin domain-containing protein 17-like [Lycorma delicatula]|uniref:thioredoxin domain-containing protein 17-like n=1 Tax=Lycorma delicatula TaxID=130591 RepID=UPI003F51A864
MVKIYTVEGYENFTEKVRELENLMGEDEKIIILFSGSRSDEGVSWCPDCVKAEPVIETILKKYEDNESIYFLHVSVGERTVWKNPHCEFRTDPKLRLTSIPALVRWKGGQRLIEEECSDESLVELLFEEE